VYLYEEYEVEVKSVEFTDDEGNTKDYTEDAHEWYATQED
jgi:hypothetical protein